MLMTQCCTEPPMVIETESGAYYACSACELPCVLVPLMEIA